MQHSPRLIGVIALVLSVGCNSQPTTVGLQGEVTFNGRAIEKGKIDLVPTDNTPGASVVATITNGRYEVPDKWGPLPDGVYLVQLVAFRKSGRQEIDRLMPGSPPVEAEENFIPPTYNRDSTLKVKIADLPDKKKADFRIGITPADVSR